MDKEIDLFLKYLINEKRYSEKTIISYNNDLLNYKEFIERKKINYKNIDRDQIRMFLHELDDKKLKNSTVSRLLSSLRHFYSFLVLNDVIITNPFKFGNFFSFLGLRINLKGLVIITSFNTKKE